MPLVRTPMIEPTAEFRGVPALAPEDAADMVLRPLLTREPQLGTYMGSLWSLLHVILPVAAGQLLNAGHRDSCLPAADAL